MLCCKVLASNLGDFRTRGRELSVDDHFLNRVKIYVLLFMVALKETGLAGKISRFLVLTNSRT